MSDKRPIWLTREQRDWLAQLADDYLLDGDAQEIREHVAQWDAAPADAEQAVTVATRPNNWTSRDVLRALGCPDE